MTAAGSSLRGGAAGGFGARESGVVSALRAGPWRA